MGLLAFTAIAVSQLVEYIITEKLAQSVNGTSADRLLNTIASEMLSVTIFSITVMVSVYQSSSSQWTPRIHRLILHDRNTQNTMAVFIGAYVYALLGIILRETGVYDDDHAFVLFWMTVAVLIVIVVYLIRWVLHLQGFGQLIDITRQIEMTTRDQFKERLSQPCLEARPFTGDLPEGTRALTHGRAATSSTSIPKRSTLLQRATASSFTSRKTLAVSFSSTRRFCRCIRPVAMNLTGTACAKAYVELWWWEICGPMTKTRVSG